MKKSAVLMKQTVAPLQANEVNIVRRKLASFDVSNNQRDNATSPDLSFALSLSFQVKQHKFRERFRKTAPFQYECEADVDVYALMDKVQCNSTQFDMIVTSNLIDLYNFDVVVI